MKTNVLVYRAEHERDNRFYGYIGPYALNREVTAELHDTKYGCMYDESYATWIILLDKKENLLGFCAMFEKEKEIFFDHFYILKEHRGKGLGKELFQTRLNMAKSIAEGRKIRGVTMNEIQYNVYLKYGFELASKRGKYYWMIMEE